MKKVIELIEKQQYSEALKYLNKVIELYPKNDEYYINLLKLKAMIYENLDKNKAREIYFFIIDMLENDPILYDRTADLVIDEFKFPKNLSNLNFNDSAYNKATQLLRQGDLDEAIKLYKTAINRDKYCYPAYLGISQALYEKNFSIRKINDFDAPIGISNLFKNYNKLNKFEKNIVHASVAPLECFIEKLNEANSHFIVVPIDVRLTDFPSNQYLRDKSYSKNFSYCRLRGIGGSNAYVGIERLRDLLWNIPEKIKFTPASVAHEFAHQVWCVINQNIRISVEKIYKQAKKTCLFISNYSSLNPQEYFAEYYAYYIRLITANIQNIEQIVENDPMIKIITDLKN
ncbi:MAG: tetratricopeptide repeat protein [bacterium]